MPIYSFRCRACGELTDQLTSVAELQDNIGCEHCQSVDTYRVIGRTAYHASEGAKTARLDPKYEKRVDDAMRRSSNADPNHLYKKMTPFSAASDKKKGKT